MEAVAVSPELGHMDDMIKITKSVLILLNDIFQKSSFLEEENFAFLFGCKDEDGNICFPLCVPRKKITSLSKDSSDTGIVCGISKMADGYPKKKKMICCIINISPNERFVSDDFLREQHTRCLNLRNKLVCTPFPVGCVFGYGGFDSLTGKPSLRLFAVDSVGILEYKKIEIYDEHHLSEVIIDEDKRTKC